MKITIPISVGELIDKITILEIKSELTNNQYVIKELNDLNIISNTVTPYVKDHMEKLREINRQLWKIEDKLRKLEKEQKFDSEFIELARSVYITNDNRANIKKEINKICNSDFFEVKIYE